jgi:hypothetical protein
MKPEITLIKKRSPNPVMSKRLFLDAQGKVCSDGSQCLMAQGTATRAAAETAAGPRLIHIKDMKGLLHNG